MYNFRRDVDGARSDPLVLQICIHPFRPCCMCRRQKEYHLNGQTSLVELRFGKQHIPATTQRLGLTSTRETSSCAATGSRIVSRCASQTDACCQPACNGSEDWFGGPAVSGGLAARTVPIVDAALAQPSIRFRRFTCSHRLLYTLIPSLDVGFPGTGCILTCDGSNNPALECPLCAAIQILDSLAGYHWPTGRK